MNRDALKDAMAKHIVRENLPFMYIESETLMELIALLNPEAVDLMVKADAITLHIVRMYQEIKEEVRLAMTDDTILAINCTCDVWTSPNNDSILGITGHWMGKNGLQVQNFFIYKAKEFSSSPKTFLSLGCYNWCDRNFWSTYRRESSELCL